MPINYPGPFQVRFNYTVPTVNVLPHTFALNCNCPTLVGAPGDPFTEWTPVQRNGGAVKTLDTHVDDLVEKFRAAWNNTVTMVNAELWKYQPLSFNADWQSTKGIGLTGTGTTAPIANRQIIMSFRTTQGGHSRFVLMEHGSTPGPTQQLPLGSVALDAIADYFLDGNNPWIGRDNGYPIAFLGMHPGENERLFKKRYRA